MIVYLLLINAAALVFMFADKLLAKKHRSRITETTLMLSAALGGSIGALLGMLLFRHKTKHRKFTLGVPLILCAQLLLLALWKYLR